MEVGKPSNLAAFRLRSAIIGSFGTTSSRVGVRHHFFRMPLVLQRPD